MNRSFWLAAPICALVVGSAAYWEYDRDVKDASNKITVTIKDIQRPSNDPATVARVNELSEKLEALMHTPAAAPVPASPPPEPPSAPAAEPRAVTGSQFLERLEKQTTVTEDERKSLTRVFKIAAEMQPGIDAEPSDHARAVYQRQLIDSLALRCKLILKDDQRLAIAREGLADMPRIMPDI